jgi:hypothetical protein
MRRLFILGLLSAVFISACAGVMPGDEPADQASDVSVVVYKSPT